MSRSGAGCAALVLVVAAAIGCAGGEAPSGYDPTMPPVTVPAMTLTSENGAWDVSLWLYPAPARKGSNDVVYGVTDRAGAAVDGLTIATQPWMPSHGHGTSTAPTIAPQGTGLYWATPVRLYMSGRWELRTTLSGEAEDRVVFFVDVP